MCIRDRVSTQSTWESKEDVKQYLYSILHYNSKQMNYSDFYVLFDNTLAYSPAKVQSFSASITDSSKESLTEAIPIKKVVGLKNLIFISQKNSSFECFDVHQLSGGMSQAYAFFPSKFQRREDLASHHAAAQELLNSLFRSNILSKYSSKLFNKLGANEKKIKVLNAALMKVEDIGHEIFRVFPYFLKVNAKLGNYVKFNNLEGISNIKCRNSPWLELLSTFAHFSFCVSYGKYLITSFIGTIDDKTIYLLLPQAQVEGELPSEFNLGNLGIQKFFQSHVCNDICKRCFLPRVNCIIPEIECKPLATPIDFLEEQKKLEKEFARSMPKQNSQVREDSHYGKKN
eukprot:TRINITY_DN5169_c0_g1_i4.p1 TRINITY_DN5169_c0_g1~~TRINITY_DN5169_c0_g1_i4.p1  ORF type:complete len:343 (-),score=62.89 TRINITY_DN5169_c0_g1_i4:605-1633(-)